MTESERARTGMVQVAVDLPPDLVAELGAFCKTNKVKKRVVHETALRRFLASETGEADGSIY